MSDQPEALRVAQTTLNAIREHGPCADGWAKLLRHLGKTQADDEPLTLATILDSNGIEDALWCLRAADGWEREARLYAVWCVRQVQHLMTDSRSLAALNVVERYAGRSGKRSEGRSGGRSVGRSGGRSEGRAGGRVSAGVLWR